MGGTKPMAVVNGQVTVPTAGGRRQPSSRTDLLGTLLRSDYERAFREHLHTLSAAATGPVHLGGRLLWIKKILFKLIRPYQQRQTNFNRLVLERFADLY